MNTFDWMRSLDARHLIRLWPLTFLALAGFMAGLMLLHAPAQDIFVLMLLWGAGPLVIAFTCGYGFGIAQQFRGAKR